MSKKRHPAETAPSSFSRLGVTRCRISGALANYERELGLTLTRRGLTVE